VSPISLDAQVEFRGAVLALERFEREGIKGTDIALRKVAEATATDARSRGGQQYGQITVRKAGAGEYAVVAMQQDGRHIANYNNYGTLASRRPKSKRPGTRYDHAKRGIKRKRFLRKPPKSVVIDAMLDAVVLAGRISGLRMKRGV
jgi:hypothetical protein